MNHIFTEYHRIRPNAGIARHLIVCPHNLAPKDTTPYILRMHIPSPLHISNISQCLPAHIHIIPHYSAYKMQLCSCSRRINDIKTFPLSSSSSSRPDTPHPPRPPQNHQTPTYKGYHQ